jgi:hypothetical protein
MAKFEQFEQLDDEAFFVEFVTEHFEKAWEEVTQQVGIRPVIDSARVKLAYDTYMINVEEIRVKLDSQNPDHYKRAASLLDALNRAQVIQNLEIDGHTYDSLENNTAVGLSYDDCQYRLKFFERFDDSGNQAMAFDVAFRCCEVYEAENRPYNPNYFENMCHYLCENDKENVGSLYMIFKSYWF